MFPARLTFETKNLRSSPASFNMDLLKPLLTPVKSWMANNLMALLLWALRLWDSFCDERRCFNIGLHWQHWNLLSVYRVVFTIVYRAKAKDDWSILGYWQCATPRELEVLRAMESQIYTSYYLYIYGSTGVVHRLNHLRWIDIFFSFILIISIGLRIVFLSYSDLLL